MKYTIWTLLYFLSISLVYSQTSLYTGINPYRKNLKTGDIIKVSVSNNFIVNLSGEYNRNFEVKLKLIPDNKNLPFLKSSEESRANIRKSKEKQIVVEKFVFSIPVRILLQEDGTIMINGNSTINSNGKITQVTITGIINESSIKNGVINSSDVVNLNLMINSRPELPKDRSLILEENKESTDSSGFSEAEVRKYINQYLQEVLGGLQ